MQAYSIKPSIPVNIHEAGESSCVEGHRLVRTERPARRIEVLDVLAVNNQVTNAVPIEVDGSASLPARNGHRI